jgi:hypothetical protein
MLRQVTISVIIGTFLIGTYYVVAASYIPPEQQDVLASKLDQYMAGLSFDKLMSLDEADRAVLIQGMPSETVRLLIQEAKSHPSLLIQTADDIRQQTKSDVRFAKLAQITALKGYEASGTAILVESASQSFVRLENLNVTPGIDQHVFLTKDGSATSGVDLGPLKATRGSQNYDATGIDTEMYNVVIVYSKTLDAHYAHARFLKSG